LEQADLNKRLILALVLSFFVFVIYGYFFPTTTQQVNTQETTTQSSTSSSSPTAPSVSQEASTPKQNLKNPPQTTSTSELLTTIISNTFKISIDKLARISQYELLEEKYKDDDGKNLLLLGTQEVKPLELRFSDIKLNNEAFNTPYIYDGSNTVDVSSASKTFTYTQTLSTVVITKKITIEPNGAYTIDVTTSTPVAYFITPGHRPMADNSIYMLVRGALIKGSDDVILTVADGDATGNETVKNAKIASAFDRYVASLFYNLDKGMDASILKEDDDNPLIFISGTENLHLGGYIGPKEYNTLKSINPELTDAIEFGWFTFLSTPFFKVLLWIENIVCNWGWAIILFTLLV